MNSISVVLSIIALAAIGAGVLITRAVLGYCLRNEVLDSPNARSSHVVPTPRGGGLSISAAGITAAAGAGLAGWLPASAAVATAVGAGAITWIGWRDDHRHVPARARLLVHAGAATLLVAALGGVPEVTLGAGSVHLGLAGSVMAVLLVIWLINLYNFMDGIDGLAGAEAVVAGAVCAAVLALAGAPGYASVAAAVAGASAGFLLYNRPPARIFMGDVGSGTVGFFFAAFALGAERHSDAAGLLVLLPLGVFITDATFTLIRRIARGERVYEAHRSHAYQRLTARGWSHGSVTALVTALNLGLAIVTFAVFHRPDALVPAVAGVVLVLPGIAYLLLRERNGARRGSARAAASRSGARRQA